MSVLLVLPLMGKTKNGSARMVFIVLTAFLLTWFQELRLAQFCIGEVRDDVDV